MNRVSHFEDFEKQLTQRKTSPKLKFTVSNEIGLGWFSNDHHHILHYDIENFTKNGIENGMENGTQNEKPFQCSQCSANFTLKGNLTRHIQSIHEGIKPFKCEICDRTFSQKSNLNNHKCQEIEVYDTIGKSIF